MRYVVGIVVALALGVACAGRTPVPTPPQGAPDGGADGGPVLDRDLWSNCYHMCDTEVKALSVDERGASCLCKTRDEVPSRFRHVEVSDER